MKGLFYRIKLGLLAFSNPIDHTLNNALLSALESGIRSVGCNSEYELNIVFNSDVVLNAWNGNKYYAWLSNGKIIHPNGNTYTYNKGRPHIETMVQLLNAMDDQFK